MVLAAEPPGPKEKAIAAMARAQVELERAMAEMDKLPALDIHSIALAAHALSNFLTVSRGVVDLLIPLLSEHPDRQIGVWVEGLAHANDLMAHIVSLLMNNAIGANPTLRLDDVDLARLVERACAYYQRSATLKGVELVYDRGGISPPVRADRVLVAAVLDNLLSNAAKYSPPGGHIWVTVRAERDGVVCSVRDEGPGLSAADQQRLFLPGVRLTPTPSGGESSSGYGLAIAKRFVDLLGGELTCTSTPGQGATFSLWLPPVGPPP
jgi:two-component system sensor histidine kinase/response regulator